VHNSAILQNNFIWFVMGFRTLRAALSFVTLNFNPKDLYTPSDFSNEENFANTLTGTQCVSMSLHEVTRQLEESKKRILNHAVEQITAPVGARAVKAREYSRLAASAYRRKD
jgi:hypothetical protein